jgi:nucleoside-diphosphate-sugar epimerase
VGQALVRVLAARGHAVVVAGRLPPVGTQVPFLACDATDPVSLRAALVEADWVVNAMAGPAAARVAVATNLAAVLDRLPLLRLVHISSLAVFGQRDGVLSESVAPLPAAGHAWGAFTGRTARGGWICCARCCGKGGWAGWGRRARAMRR